MRPDWLRVSDMVQGIAVGSIRSLGHSGWAEARMAEMVCQLLHASVRIAVVDSMCVVLAELVC